MLERFRAAPISAAIEMQRLYRTSVSEAEEKCPGFGSRGIGTKLRKLTAV